MKRHYHVTAALPGCLPDSIDYYTTKRDAQRGMKWTLDTWKDAYPDGRKLEGSQQAGYYVFDRYAHDPDLRASNIVIELSVCTDDCDPDACI